MSYSFAELASAKIFANYVLKVYYITCAKLLLKLFRRPRAANSFLHARMRFLGCMLVNPALMHAYHYYIKLIFPVYSSMIVFICLAATVLTVFLVLTCYRIFVAVFWWRHDRDVFVNGKNAKIYKGLSMF
jgi:hypothetical protein